jgi:hypothetical protein
VVAPLMTALANNAERRDLSQRSRRATGRDLFACRLVVTTKRAMCRKFRFAGPGLEVP